MQLTAKSPSSGYTKKTKRNSMTSSKMETFNDISNMQNTRSKASFMTLLPHISGKSPIACYDERSLAKSSKPEDFIIRNRANNLKADFGQTLTNKAVHYAACRRDQNGVAKEMSILNLCFYYLS